MIRFAIIAFVASCILAALAVAAPSRRAPSGTTIRPALEVVAPPAPTIRRVRNVVA